MGMYLIEKQLVVGSGIASFFGLPQRIFFFISSGCVILWLFCYWLVLPCLSSLVFMVVAERADSFSAAA